MLEDKVESILVLFSRSLDNLFDRCRFNKMAVNNCQCWKTKYNQYECFISYFDILTEIFLFHTKKPGFAFVSSSYTYISTIHTYIHLVTSLHSTEVSSELNISTTQEINFKHG